MIASNRVRVLDNRGLVGGVAGIGFVVLMLAGGVVQGDVPVYSQPSTDIRQWFADNGDRYLVGWLLIGAGVFLYLAYLAALVSMLFESDGARSPWPWLALLGGVHLVVAAQASVAFDGALALLEGDLSDEFARTLSAGDYMTFSLLYPFAAIHTLGVSLCILRTGVLWRALAWFGPIVTVAGLLSIGAPLQRDADGVLTTVGYATLFGFLIFSTGVSLSMIRTGRQP